MARVQDREYERESSIVFRKTSERFGGLSNMAAGFPVVVNGIQVRTSEALYQACRFPHLPDVQRLVIEQISPMAAKMKSKPFRKQSRPDWDSVRVKVMRWCLRVKLAQNWEKFSALLKATGDRPIVEESVKDDFWGAHPSDDGRLAGHNVLGRLLMELREELASRPEEFFHHVAPLTVPDFVLYGEPIGPVDARTTSLDVADEPRRVSADDRAPSLPLLSAPPAEPTGPANETGEFVITDGIADLEERFPLKDLLALEYFQKYRHGYYRCRDEGWQIPPRNYVNLLQCLNDIHEYRPEDARSFAKAFRSGIRDWRNSEATFAEIIVYKHYVRLVYEGLVRSVRLGREECDVIVDRLDGSVAFLEVFSVKPAIKEPTVGEIVVNDIKTHTQDALASVRQKLLRKIREQHQMTKARENYAVIELNDASIAGNFAVLSSLSSGYKVTIDPTTMKAVNAGYDWTNSVFEDEALRHLKAVIFFDLGDYESRRFINNPFFVAASERI
ncbi:MAG: NADAR family protein [Pseudorhodoplanes sp.]